MLIIYLLVIPRNFLCFSVKPAVFDLFLTAMIVAYLTAVYFGVQVRRRGAKYYKKQ